MTQIRPDSRLFLPLIFFAGAAMTLAFQPFNQVWLVFPLLALLLYAWSVTDARKAFLHGWLFSLGFQCSGVSWIFYSLHYHGGSPIFLAVVMIFLLSAYLSIYPALAGYLVNRYFKNTIPIKLMLLYPLALALFEWLQGVVMTGFAWMQIGYTQIDWPLSGYAPVLGNHGVGLFVAMTAGSLIVLVKRADAFRLALISVVVIWCAGLVLKQISWTQPVDEPLKVSLVQGNIAQSLKWKREMKGPTLSRYRDLTLQQTDTDLVVWPETAVPGYQHRMRSYLAEIHRIVEKNNAELLTGLFIKDEVSGRYYNSLINVAGGEYKKRHLVPLGEYIPLRFLASFFNRWIDIPMSDIDVGDDSQPLLRAAGQPLGVSICFEDAFARDVIRDLPEATLLVNVSNDAWFEDSHEPYQHHAIARMRALETGRYMLRATNTGVSSIINASGEVVAIAPAFETTVLSGMAQPMQGATPFVIWGNYLLVSACSIILGGLFYRNRLAN